MILTPFEPFLADLLFLYFIGPIVRAIVHSCLTHYIWSYRERNFVTPHFRAKYLLGDEVPYGNCDDFYLS